MFTKPGQTAGLPAQKQESDHINASLMAHAAASRAKAMRSLQGKGPSQGAPAAPANWKAGVAQTAAAKGVPAGVGEIHGAIDQLAQAGHLTPFQANALKNHNGPLAGQQGAATTTAVANQVLANAKGAKQPTGMP